MTTLRAVSRRPTGRPPFNAERLGRLIVETFLGVGVVRDAIDRALAACLAAGATRNLRQLVVDVALAELEELLHRELDRRLRQLDQGRERAA